MHGMPHKLLIDTVQIRPWKSKETAILQTIIIAQMLSNGGDEDE